MQDTYLQMACFLNIFFNLSFYALFVKISIDRNTYNIMSFNIEYILAI